MKKSLIIVVCCLYLCGCKNSNEFVNKENIDNNKSNKYTFCYIYSIDNNISWSIYYDNQYNVIEDFMLLSTIYDSSEEAIKAENEQKAKCNNIKDNITCSVQRINKTVDVGYENQKPDYNYYDKINELEANNWVCEERID